MSYLMENASLLKGDNTIPGVQVPPEVLERIPEILRVCREYGLDFYETVVEFLTYEEISEVAAYGGFPVRYPHWQWGEQYEDLSKGFEHGMHRIFEMVSNTRPCYIYCLDSNSLNDHITVIAHATAHNDFFKNNIYFAPTRPSSFGSSKENEFELGQNMMNELANHGTRIRKYMQEWGKDDVSKFIDKVLSIRTLIDPAKAWCKREYKEPRIYQARKTYQPRRLKVEHDYMEDWIHPAEWKKQEQERIRRQELVDSIGLFTKPEKDIFGFLKDHAPLHLWQQDIASMLYEEEIYFSPQRYTKMANEGWASFLDSQIMARFGYSEGGDIFDYAKHKASVLGGKYSNNPYKLGYSLFLYIEDCWNKGKFGREYEECDDAREKERWDKKLGLGHQKVFEVRQYYNDVNMISEFFTEEFCEKYEYFTWKRFPGGEYRIVDRDYNHIKELLIKQSLNGGLPEIKLVDPNHKGKRIFLMEHTWDGRILHPQKTRDTLRAICWLWQAPVALATRDKDGREVIYWCEDEQVEIRVRDENESVLKVEKMLR